MEEKENDSSRQSSSTTDTPAISAKHRDYLLQRHGTVDLDPLPSDDPREPLNWPQWKKVVNLLVVGFHSMMSLFQAAGVTPIFGVIAEDFDVSIQMASYTVTVQIAILAYSTFFWIPFSQKFGRRQVWLISCICCALFNVGSALSRSYGALMTCRAFGAFFASPGLAIGSGVVVETFFRKERGLYIGIWASMTTLGPPLGPLIFGFVAQRTPYYWVFWILAIAFGVECIAFLFLSPETRFLPSHRASNKSAFKLQYLNFGPIDPEPFNLAFIPKSLSFFTKEKILLPAISFGVIFMFASVFLTVLIPQLYIVAFAFGPESLGLQYIGLIIGTILGEQAAGPSSDYWISWRYKKIGRKPHPEYRLWLLYPGFAALITGLVVFPVQTQAITEAGSYNISPIVGSAIAAFGNQVVTTVVTTYCVDCYEAYGTEIGAFINMWRMTLGFTGPFWFADAYEAITLKGFAGLMAGLILVLSIFPIVYLQIKYRER